MRSKPTVSRCLVAAGILSLLFAAAAVAGVSATYRGVSRAVRFDVSPPLRLMTPLPVPREEPGERADDPPSGLEGPLGPQDIDPLVQDWTIPNGMPAPIISFNGQGNNFGGAPPDPNGDVGPDHFVAMANLSFAIYDKSGTLLYGPAANNTLWTGFGGDCETENAGDPVVLYDQLADRWMLTQFTAPPAGPYYNCVAISQTGDPTGSYYRYAFTTGANFPDYPKYGIWPDAYYIATREFAGITGPFVGIGAYALDRAQMLAGNPTPQVISFLATPGGAGMANIGDGLLPGDLDGSELPPGGTPEFFVGSMDDGGPYGAPQDALTIWEFHTDFAVPGNSTFTLAHTVPVAPFDSIFPCGAGRDCIPQPGTSTKLDILSYRQRPLHRLAYRKFPDHESMVTNQSVEAAPNVAGIRWWEIRDPHGTPTIHQEGTYAPGVGDGIHRWMGSIAMDTVGNMALGFSASDGTSTFPSVWYTGRLDGDPLGTMPQGEGSIIDGTGSQTGSSRWGDYTSMTVDPVDDCTFWYVDEWVPTTSSSGWQLRIGAFKFPDCSLGPNFTLAVTPASQGICAPADADYTVDVGSLLGFSEQVTLSASGQPAGTTAGFSVNPVTPPASSTLSITNTGAAATGHYDVMVNGLSSPSAISHDKTVGLDVYDAAPAAATLLTPANGAINQSTRPTFTWSAAAQARTYSIEIATDAGFGNVVDSASGLSTESYTASVDLATNTTHYWRVQAENACGTSTLSATFSFTVAPAPGDCTQGAAAQAVFFDNLEAGAAGWTHSGTGDTWALSSAHTHSGVNAWHATDVASVTDQYLVSPAIALPSDQPPVTMQFWNWQTIEHQTAGGCYDGAVVEISNNGGATWTRLEAELQTDPYDGAVSTGFSNPIGGTNAWCGDPQDWLNSIVDVSAWGGQTVRFRYRLATDSSVSREGWYLDDVKVQSCLALVFADGFESGDTSAWSATVP
jgi:Immune inhibitor A-like, MAM domain